MDLVFGVGSGASWRKLWPDRIACLIGDWKQDSVGYKWETYLDGSELQNSLIATMDDRQSSAKLEVATHQGAVVVIDWVMCK